MLKQGRRPFQFHESRLGEIMSRIGVLAVLFAYVCIYSACSTHEIEVEHDGRESIDSIRQNYEVTPGGTLTVDAEMGAIRIRSSIRNEVDVLVTKRLRTSDADQAHKAFSNVDVEIKQTDNGIRIEVDQIRSITYKRWFWQDDWPDRVYVEINVMVPEEYNLDLITISGDIQTGNIKGDVTAKTLSGNISTGPTEGVLSTKTNSGNIETSRTLGEFHARSLTGNIKTGPVDGDATIVTNSGSIETRNIIQGDLHAKSLTGNIKTGPVDGDATIVTNSGSIETRNIQGDLHAESLTGNIKTGPVDGDATISSNSGSIETRNIQGGLHAKSLTGNIKTGPVDGDATISSNSGSIETRNIQGGLHARSLSGNVKTGPVRNDVVVNTNSGNIETEHIQGNVQTTSLFGNISIEAVGGNVRARTHSGNIKVSDVSGVIETRSLSGDIKLDHIRGDITANSFSGDIDGALFVNDTSDDIRCEMQSLNGDITIQLPIDLPAGIDAQISIGSIIDPWLPTWWHVQRRIDSDFVLDVSRIEPSPGNYSIEAVGEINGGGNDIRLITNDGKIRIRSRDD